MNKSCYILFILVFGLFASAIFGFIVIGDRIIAALFYFWKFYGYNHDHDSGISIAADSSILFLTFCLLGIGFCFILAFYVQTENNRFFHCAIKITGVIYFIDAMILVLLLYSNLAFIQCR